MLSNRDELDLACSCVGEVPEPNRIYDSCLAAMPSKPLLKLRQFGYAIILIMLTETSTDSVWASVSAKFLFSYFQRTCVANQGHSEQQDTSSCHCG